MIFIIDRTCFYAFLGGGHCGHISETISIVPPTSLNRSAFLSNPQIPHYTNVYTFTGRLKHREGLPFLNKDWSLVLLVHLRKIRTSCSYADCTCWLWNAVIFAGEMKCKLQVFTLLLQYYVLTSTTIRECVCGLVIRTSLVRVPRLWWYLTLLSQVLTSAVAASPDALMVHFSIPCPECTLQSDLSLKAKVAGPAPVGSMPSFMWFTDHLFPSAGFLYLTSRPVASERNLIFPRQRGV